MDLGLGLDLGFKLDKQYNFVYIFVGMVELVRECSTLREIQGAQGGAAGVFKDDVLKKWLQTHNPHEFDYKVV